ncbi:unnamed protein product [Durusdinium trenchii]|uniref:Integrase catalytic domain-containing protein n=2 Tax=Durusdinium trenchii TaxID=1381693 RepID=A0ABP0N1W1_9DINO
MSLYSGLGGAEIAVSLTTSAARAYVQTNQLEEQVGYPAKPKNGSSFNRVPSWDGRPETFFHYITEIKWHLAGTKSSERPYAAARLVRRILESDYPSLKSLAYKLDPADFTTEDAVTRLISFLEASPMNRQPIPDAGRQLSAYYRRLSRKPQETIPQFLVREETLYDSMWRALQRLLREKELDFDQYDCSLDELKDFCGMADKSFYVPGQFEHESTHGAFSQGSGSGSGSTHPSRFAGNREPNAEAEDEDLPQPPLSRSQSESHHTMPIGSRHMANIVEEFEGEDMQYQDYWGSSHDYPEGEYLEDGYYGEEFQETADDPQAEESEVNPESMTEDQALHVISQLQEEEKELNAMMVDAQRNLEQARRAVQEAKKDRGWKSSGSKGSPPHGSQKGTSTFMQGKGHRSQTNFFQQKGHGFHGKGGYHNRPFGSSGWRPPQQNRFAGRSNFQNRNQMSQRPSSHAGMFMEPQEHHMMTMTDMIPEAEFSPDLSFFPVSQADSRAAIRPEEAIIDSGATVSAGGETAVKNLLHSLAQSRPDLSLTVVTEDRPYFRYGSGSWGQASYKVKLHFGSITLQLYALPSPGVPVLLGMREMQQLCMIVNLSNGHAVVLGEMRHLRMTPKRQILFSFLKDLPVQRQQHSAARSPKAELRTDRTRSSARVAQQSQQLMTLLDFSFEPNFEEQPCFVVQEPQQSDGIFANSMFEHLCVSPEQWQFLQSSASSSSKQVTFDLSQPAESVIQYGKHRRVGEQDSGGTSAKVTPKAKAKKGPKGELDPTRTMGVHTQDPRASKDFWPCKGNHDPKQYSNPHGALAGASGQSTHMDLPSNVVRAMEHLRMEGFKENDVDSRLVKKTIRYIEGQELIKAKKPGKTHGDLDKREKEKGYPAASASNPTPGPEIHNLASDDDSWEQPTPMKKKVEKKTESPESKEDMQHNELTPDAVLRDLTASLKSSVFSIEQQLRSLQEQRFSLWEMCCSPNSTLSNEVIRNGLKAQRWTIEEGFDLEKPECVAEAINALKRDCPTKIWASLRCTPWTSIQHINQRTPQQVNNLRRMRLRSRKQLRHILEIFRQALLQDSGTDFYFEWPKNATEGWRLRELEQFEQWYNATFSKPLYRTVVHGCMVGLLDEEGNHLHKPWQILTSDQHFHIHAGITCDGQHTHKSILGLGTHAVAKTAFYPVKFAKRIVQVWKHEQFSASEPKILQSLHTMDQAQDPHLHPDRALQAFQNLEDAYPVERKRTHTETQDGEMETDQAAEDETLEQDPTVSNSQGGSSILPEVSHEEREKGKVLLHRLHKSAGHPSNQSLARLIRDRKLPGWLVDEAKKLQCTQCSEVLPGNQLVLHRSIGEHPRPWQMVGMDVFELHFPSQRVKGRFLLMTCLAMHFTAVAPLWIGKFSQTGTDSGEKLISTFCDVWLHHRPRPEWVVVDSQSSLINGYFPTFMHTAGIGMLASPGEGHWIHGKTEAMVRTIKRTMKRIRQEHPLLAPSIVGTLAPHAANHTVRSTGFSPVQWAYGYDPDELERKNDPLQANGEKLFGPRHFKEFQSMRARAGELFREESARQAVSRLWNSAPRPLIDYQVGDFNFTDVSKEPFSPDHPEYQSEETERKKARLDTVSALRARWEQLVSINQNRRQEGLPPLMQLPAQVLEQSPMMYTFEDSDPQHVECSPGVQTAENTVRNIHLLDQETQKLVLERIHLLEEEVKMKQETVQLHEMITQEREDEAHFLSFIQDDFQRPEKDRQWVFQIEFDVSEEIADANPFLYAKRVLEGNKNVEITYKQLSPEHVPLFDEAKAREVAEVLGSMALRAVQSKEELKEALSHPERHIPMRWVLTWKPIQPPEPPPPDGSCSDKDPMTASETSQARALLMKAQWRSLQSAPQYAARIGIASSTLSDGKLANLREANSIIRDMRKTAKEDLVFHNFNFGRTNRLKYTDLVFLHWGDAGHNNRPTGGSTGGFVSGISSPEILKGNETPVTLIDWRSWKLRRPARGTNCSEAQGIAEAEDKGWRTRLMFAILYGHTLRLGKADTLTSMFTSLLIMDSRGCYDLLVSNESLAMSMSDSKAAIDLLHVQKGIQDGTNCFATWVPSDLNLANSLTKASTDAYREMKLFHTNKSWIVKFNEEFISARKMQRLRTQKKKEEQKQGLHFADMPEDPPEFLVPSLEDFLKKGSPEVLLQLIESKRDECAALFKRMQTSPDQAVAKAEAKVKAASKRKNQEAAFDQAKVRTEAAQSVRDAKKSLAQLSKDLVLELVKKIECEGMLKDAICTGSDRPTFDASIFASLFPNYAVESVLTHPTDFGFPARRTRLYTLLVRDDFKLLRGMDDLHRLYISPGMDCSAFRAAEEQEAKKTVHSAWLDLLPVAAGVHLQSALKLEKVRAALARSPAIAMREVAINLSQNPLCQEHFGSVAPVVLASSTCIWGVLQGRPYTAKEMLEMQGIPIHTDALEAAQISRPFFDPGVVSVAAQKRLAGNSFQQGCMSAFLCFALAFVMPAKEWDENKIPVAIRPRLASNARVWCLGSSSEAEDGGSEEE